MYAEKSPDINYESEAHTLPTDDSACDCRAASVHTPFQLDHGGCAACARYPAHIPVLLACGHAVCRDHLPLLRDWSLAIAASLNSTSEGEALDEDDLPVGNPAAAITSVSSPEAAQSQDISSSTIPFQSTASPLSPGNAHSFVLGYTGRPSSQRCEHALTDISTQIIHQSALNLISELRP